MALRMILSSTAFDASKIIAVDFDGTMATIAYPSIGEELPDAVRTVQDLQARGYKVILWTCRCGTFLEEAIEWCADRGITFDAVNENLPEICAHYGEQGSKITAGHYLDDRNFPPVPMWRFWTGVRQYFLGE